MILSIAIIFIVLLHARYYEHRELFLRKYFTLYRTYIENIPNKGTERYREAFHSLQENQLRIVEYFKECGLPEGSIPIVEPMGYGYVQPASIHVYDNLLVQRKDVIRLVMGMFRTAIGYYRRKKKDSFNIFYWLEFIIKLPKRILDYLKIPTDNITTKIIQIVYWIIAILFGVYKALGG